MKKRLELVSIVLCALSLGACTQWVHIPTGTIGTPGVTLEASDPDLSFRWVSGEQFQVPTALVANQPGAGTGCMYQPDAEDTHIAPRAEAVRNGRRSEGGLFGGIVNVRVEHPAYSGPLYGLLELCAVPQLGAGGPASRSLEIRIPNSVVEATSGSRVAVTYERTTRGPTVYTWRLWLARSPL